MYHSLLWVLSPLKLASSPKWCIPTPKTLSSLKLKLYDYKCFYLLNDDFSGKFQNPFSPQLFTEIFGDFINKKTPLSPLKSLNSCCNTPSHHFNVEKVIICLYLVVQSPVDEKHKDSTLKLGEGGLCHNLCD